MYFFSFEGFLPKAKPPINVVGDVGGKIAIIIVSANYINYPLFFLSEYWVFFPAEAEYAHFTTDFRLKIFF